MAIDAFRCIGDDGQFCVVRLTAAEAETMAADPLLLLVADGDDEHRLVPVDAEDDDRSADFLLPSALRTAREFVLQAGRERHRLPPPSAPEGNDPGAAARVYLALQQELADQADRLVELRSELRREHQRTAAAEDARAELELDLTETQSSAGSRARLDRDLAKARKRVAELEREANDIDDRRESLASQLAEAQAALTEERSVRAAAEERAAEAAREADAIDERRQLLEAELAEARSALEEALATGDTS
jgi:chromosome segregation protein